MSERCCRECGQVIPENKERLPFAVSLATSQSARLHTVSAFEAAKKAGKPFSRVLFSLRDCYPASEKSAGYYRQERVGATYKQLAAIAHKTNMTDEQRFQWYELCESIPLSQRQANHILTRIEGQS